MQLQDRRNFLKTAAQALGATTLLSPLISQAQSISCSATPSQTSGPFYPGEDSFEVSNNLSQLPNRPAAIGEVVVIKGQVLDSLCKPIKNANVEIWQACASGRYNNQRDPNNAPLDPNFKYWGEAFTNDNGEYEFKTIIPGAYPADTNWTRPPHIHYRVAAVGYHDLVTQMYFAGNPLNEADLILDGVPEAERPSLIVDFKPAPTGLDAGIPTGVFNLTLRSVRG